MAKHGRQGEGGGRPSKYYEGIEKEVDKYLATTGREQTTLPTIEGLAVYFGVSKQSIIRWYKKDKKFRFALRKLMAKQAEQLINDGIYGGKEVNSTIVKLMLMNNHGYREKSEVNQNMKGNINLIFDSSLKVKE